MPQTSIADIVSVNKIMYTLCVNVKEGLLLNVVVGPSTSVFQSKVRRYWSGGMKVFFVLNLRPDVVNHVRGLTNVIFSYKSLELDLHTTAET